MNDISTVGITYLGLIVMLELYMLWWLGAGIMGALGVEISYAKEMGEQTAECVLKVCRAESLAYMPSSLHKSAKSLLNLANAMMSASLLAVTLPVMFFIDSKLALLIPVATLILGQVQLEISLRVFVYPSLYQSIRDLYSQTVMPAET